ncbi:MAG: DUF5684 domain-containing protein [bacterium]
MFLALIWLAVVVLMVSSMWIVFTKAGQPGWACLVPFYNLYVMLKIAGKPGWWLVLFLIPVVNLVVGIITYISLAANFGKSAGFAIGMIFLPIVFFPMLAFGDAKYVPSVGCA